MELDRIDVELIRLLRKNARLPNKELAARVGVAPSTALERVRRLREARVLLGFHAEVAPEAVGIGLQAMVAVWSGGEVGQAARSGVAGRRRPPRRDPR